MKYFITSDIHGHYQVLLHELNKVGFEEENISHHLIVLGDMFDRGDESKEVFEYLYRLNEEGKATIILGNHDTFMIELLEGNYDRALFNVARNGFMHTLLSFTEHKLEENDPLEKYQEMINQEYPHLIKWLRSLPLYHEIGEYIFVHGGVDPNMDDWRKASTFDFVWSYEVNMDRVPERTVVAGHHRVPTIREPYRRDYEKMHKEDPSLFDPIYLDGKILIDRFVEVSKELNVLVLDL
jgi:serine/threonine protein phosphatase 1